MGTIKSCVASSSCSDAFTHFLCDANSVRHMNVLTKKYREAVYPKKENWPLREVQDAECLLTHYHCAFDNIT
jgi:hypothetical protein